MSRTQFEQLNAALEGKLASLGAGARLKALAEHASGRLVFTTSFGLEDQVITHLIAEAGLDVQFATLDTGRMFPQTYALWHRTEARYGIHVTAFYPEASALEGLVRSQGINGFYRSVEARKACCGVRKVAPLARALNGAAVWITGLRADQSEARSAASVLAFDAGRGLGKFAPLIDWTRAEAAAFAQAHDVPVNDLHAHGFLSIGCAPCTRAVAPGQIERAGRWWWEDESAKECGLHVGPDGRLVRAGPSEVRA